MFDDLFTLDAGLERKFDAMLEASENGDYPNFWEQDNAVEIRVPVAGGSIRVIHVKPENPAGRPVVFASGWGTAPRGFQDYYEPLHGKVELYYVETREKRSSRIARRDSCFDMEQKARDIQAVIEFCGLDGVDFILMGACWGAGIILQGLISGIIKAPTYLLADPMHTLWFSKFVIRYIGPFIPVSLLWFLRPVIKYFKLRNMDDPKQMARAEDFIGDAVLWKWKKAALHVNDFELFGKMSLINEEIFIINGTHDLIHNRHDYPRLAAEAPRGRFLYLKARQETRERLMGVAAVEFAMVGAAEGIPPSLRPYEKKIR